MGDGGIGTSALGVRRLSFLVFCFSKEQNSSPRPHPAGARYTSSGERTETIPRTSKSNKAPEASSEQ